MKRPWTLGTAMTVVVAAFTGTTQANAAPIKVDLGGIKSYRTTTPATPLGRSGVSDAAAELLFVGNSSSNSSSNSIDRSTKARW